MPFVAKDWRDSPGDLTTPITAAALENLESRTTAGIPYENVLWHGAVGDGVHDDTAAIQAADAAAAASEGTGGTVFFPPGNYIATAGLTYSERVSWKGSGMRASQIAWFTSTGAGNYALAPSFAIDVGHFGTISDLGFLGPATGMGLTPGTANTTMHGVKIYSRSLVEGCEITDFNNGLAIAQDHSSVRDCTISNNHRNLAFIACPIYGDHSVIACALVGASLANIAVDDGTFIAGSHFIGCHLGNAPYGVYSPPGRTTPQFLNDTEFIDIAVEGYGNAIIYGGSTNSQLADFYWRGGSGCVQEDAYKLPATTFNYAIDVGHLSNCIFEQRTVFLSIPALGWIHASGDAGGVFVRTDNMAPASGKPVIVAAGGLYGGTWATSEMNGRFAKAGAALTEGQLVKTNGPFDCALYGATDGATGVAAAGFAFHACAANEVVAIATGGYIGSRALAGAAITNGRLLKPDTAVAGRVIQVADGADGPIVGVAMGSQGTPGSAFAAEARCGSWASR